MFLELIAMEMDFLMRLKLQECLILSIHVILILQELSVHTEFTFQRHFSPNGDNNNDIFSVVIGQDVASFVIHIYDRWGNEMINTDDKLMEWDGTYNSEECNSGVYAYLLEAVMNDGTPQVRSGNITLFR